MFDKTKSLINIKLYTGYLFVNCDITLQSIKRKLFVFFFYIKFLYYFKILIILFVTYEANCNLF